VQWNVELEKKEKKRKYSHREEVKEGGGHSLI
jgi:hypothetical protein